MGRKWPLMGAPLIESTEYESNGCRDIIVFDIQSGQQLDGHDDSFPVDSITGQILLLAQSGIYLGEGGECHLQFSPILRVFLDLIVFQVYRQ